MESPLIQVGLIVLTAYIFRLWLSDFRTESDGAAKPGALPGAAPCKFGIVIIGICGACILVAVETWGEHWLGISAEQSSMTLLFAVVTLAAGFGEELIFRGYLVVQNRGKVMLWVSIFGFSLVFATAHPYLWEWKDGSLVFNATKKAWFSTGVVFLNSVWFYWLRFNPANPSRSLWPCIAAHTASNLAVFGTKLVQGHYGGIY